MKRTEISLLILAALCAVGGVILLALSDSGVWAVLLCLAACGLTAGVLAVQRRRWLRTEAELQRTLQEQRQSGMQSLMRQREEHHSELERFRSELAHGLRIPIAIVQGYAELMVEDKVPDAETQKDYLLKILQRTQYMSAILVKQFSFIDMADSAVVNFAPVDLVQLIRQIADDMQNIAGNQDVQIQVATIYSSLMVDADAYQLSRIFFNLLENAIKYMGRAGVVTVRVAQQAHAVDITVKDDGLGLPEEETAHIFEQDYRGSNRAGNTGSGHGLSLVRHMVLLHGGTVAAESATGRGMAIHISLPLHQPAPIPQEAARC